MLDWKVRVRPEVGTTWEHDGMTQRRDIRARKRMTAVGMESKGEIPIVFSR